MIETIETLRGDILRHLARCNGRLRRLLNRITALNTKGDPRVVDRLLDDAWATQNSFEIARDFGECLKD
jgi:hypothetical protein